MTGEAAKLYETSKPNWLPTLNLGHTKFSVRTQDEMERYERSTERARRRNAYEDMMKETPVVVSQLMEEIIIEESRIIATEQLEIGMQYVKVAVGDTDDPQTTEHDSSSNIATLQRELSSAKLTIEKLTQQLNDHLPPFCEQSFVTDEYTKFHTGLPNFKVVKATFDHVSKGLPTNRVAKLSNFQEFMCLMLKLRTNIPNEGLAHQFGVSQATISRIILK